MGKSVLAGLALVVLLNGCGSSYNKEKVLPVHCLDKPDPGPCDGREARYYYDYPSNRCRRFYYGGCKGRVPFRSRAACEAACVAGAPNQ